MVWLEIIIVIALILLNGLLSMSEMAVVTSRQPRLEQKAEEGNRRARAALELARAPDRFLSTVQVGITLVGILSGAFGGATLAAHLGEALRGISFLDTAGPAVALVLVVATITFLTLVFGELVPKRAAMLDPEGTAMAITPFMNGLSAVVYPAVRLLTASTRLVISLLGLRQSNEPPVTEEDIRGLLEQGVAAGVFTREEHSMVHSAFELSDQPVRAVITPRTEIDWLDITDPPEETLRRVLESGHSLFPVGRKELDQVFGVVRARDLLTQKFTTGTIDLKAILQSPLFVPESMIVARLPAVLREWGTNMALVLDEYGGLAGLVTTQDILEELVGTLERNAPQAVKRPDGSWLIDGLLPADEFRELFGLDELPGEDQGRFNTVAGFVLMQMGRVPRPSERVEWGGLQFEVLDMDGNRIDKLLVTGKIPGRDGSPDAGEGGGRPGVD